ncbi:MAG: hypothetical protein ABL962_11985 [Fimbriimonadaceae bacterium]
MEGDPVTRFIIRAFVTAGCVVLYWIFDFVFVVGHVATYGQIDKGRDMPWAAVNPLLCLVALSIWLIPLNARRPIRRKPPNKPPVL